MAVLQVEDSFLHFLSDFRNFTSSSQPLSIQNSSLYSRWRLSTHAAPGAPQVVLVIKSLPASAGDVRDVDSIPGSGRSPGGGHGTPLQYSCLENPMDGGVWRGTVHGVTKRWTGCK